MAKDEQLAILRQGVEVWNKWRKENLYIDIDLSGISLPKLDYSWVNLSVADLSKSNLSYGLFLWSNFDGAKLNFANLNYAHFRGAQVSAVNFRGTKMVEATLNQANLSSSNFEEADLTGAYLYHANLADAKLDDTILSNAHAYNTVFAGIDLSKVKGLESVEHFGSSHVGLDTLVISKGNIPIEFLRGCGLSDLEIEYSKLTDPVLSSEQLTNITYNIHQLYLGGGIKYYSCFISYSSIDQEFTEKIHDDLQDNGVRCWFAPENMKIGDLIRPTIDQQIRQHDKLLVILSENSVNSEWVGDEVEAALEEESKSNRLVLFPIRLDDTVMSNRDDWAAKIKRRRHIGDFSNWKDKASYQKAFERLLRDLKAMGNT